jgi:hypothetical protein
LAAEVGIMAGTVPARDMPPAWLLGQIAYISPGRVRGEVEIKYRRTDS